MKKLDTVSIKKMKLDDFEIGKTLGKGTPSFMQELLAKSKLPRTRKMENMWHWSYSRKMKSLRLSKLIMSTMRTLSTPKSLIPSLLTLRVSPKIPDISILFYNWSTEENSSPTWGQSILCQQSIAGRANCLIQVLCSHSSPLFRILAQQKHHLQRYETRKLAHRKWWLP